MMALLIQEYQTGYGGALTTLCALASINRLEVYRHLHHDPAYDRDKEARGQIGAVVRDWPLYGIEKVTDELRRRDHRLNHKRVYRIMKECNWLHINKRKRKKTTQSDHEHAIFPNLARGMELTGLDQLWVADITYIHLVEEDAYLAVILDAYSRRCIGWHLSASLDHSLPLQALESALRTREVSSGLVHHSDQGVQYACGEYVDRLQSVGIRPSMSRKGIPQDNAKAESFFKTAKCEEVYLNEYLGIADARKQIGRFIEKVYNEARLHSALGFMPPCEFEALLSGTR